MMLKRLALLLPALGLVSLAPACDGGTAPQIPADGGSTVCALCELDARPPAADTTIADLPGPSDFGPSDIGSSDGGTVAADAGGSTPDSTVADAAPQPYVHEDVTPAEVAAWLSQGKPLTLLDVREPAEFASGHIEGAINLPLTSGVLKQKIQTLPKHLPLVVYCRSGNRSNTASIMLTDAGYQPVYDLGGILGWTAAGYAVVK